MQPTLSCYKTATDNKIAGYYRIVEEDDQRVQAVVSAIQADHPVVFGTAIGQELLSFAGTDTVYAPKKSIGNHAMMIVGWRSSPTLSFYVRNSWGQAWGDGTGHFWIDADYIASSLSDDFWVPTLMSSIC
jgi:C1A family cysteine protease